MHVVRVTWKSQDDSFASGITVWKRDRDELEFVELIEGSEITWTIIGPRSCIGRRASEREFIKCPIGNVVTKSRIKCDSCLESDYFDPCIRCAGHICNASESRFSICNTTPYVVYAAIFNDGSLKVGVSSSHRIKTRWVEQGADYAGILAHVTGGKQARLIESELGRRGGVATRIHGARKQAMLMKDLSIDEAYQIVEPLLNSHPIISSGIDLIDLSTYYSISSLDAEPHRWLDSHNSITGLQVAGEVVGMKGSLLITKTSGSFYMIDLKSIVGYSIDFEAEIRIEAQSSLLEYF
ncbi:MAG: DUF2797 domain-containing protein [Candidatus Thorarchaeota archaeon]